MAADFKAKGAERLHVVDLDGAFSDSKTIRRSSRKSANSAWMSKWEGLRSPEAPKELFVRGALGDFRDCCGKES